MASSHRWRCGTKADGEVPGGRVSTATAVNQFVPLGSRGLLSENTG
jgi:hypothetical protein